MPAQRAETSAAGQCYSTPEQRSPEPERFSRFPPDSLPLPNRGAFDRPDRSERNPVALTGEADRMGFPHFRLPDANITR